MDTVIFHHFLVIAETLSFTKAAEILDKLEPVLSRQISRLESELGVTLFYRNHGGLALTPAGLIFKNSISDMNTQIAMTLKEMRAIAATQQNNINIGIIENHFISDKGRELFTAFIKEYPNITLKYFSFSISDLIRFLNDGKIDFVYGALVDFQQSDSFDTISIDRADHNLLVCCDHPIFSSGKDDFCLADFKDEVILISQEHAPFNEIVGPLSKSFGFTPKFRVISDLTALLAMVQVGKGIFFADSTCTYYSSPFVRKIHLPELGTLPLGLIAKNEKQSNTNRLLLKFASQFVNTVTPRCPPP